MFTVHFHDVGRQKACWTSTLAALTHSRLLAAVHAIGAIKGDDVYFTLSANETSGEILGGSLRTVGTFTVQPAPPCPN